MDHSKYVKGELKLVQDIKGLKIFCDNDLVCERHISPDASPEIKATMELMAESKVLLQVAEMYYDFMVSNKQEGTLPFTITEKVLKKLKTR